MRLPALFLSLLHLPLLPAQSERVKVLDAAEAQLRVIYQQGAYRARPFRGAWLPDSSGYTLRERGGRVVKVDAAGGARSEFEVPARQGPSGPRIEVRRGDLYLRPAGGGARQRLTENASDAAVRNGRASLSPDGEQVLFVEHDLRRVRVRSYLQAEDPSYPKVRETRFARVGGEIAALRVGVVPAAGGRTRWLDVPRPREGYYLGQVEWAGNSREVLVEWLSRFRDRRAFLLFDLKSGAVRRIFEEQDPAWVLASYRLNAGLTWLRGGRSFLVIHERDGWRHAHVYSREGEHQAALTPGEYDIIEAGPVDHAGGWFYFYASPDNAAERYLYRVPLDASARPTRITPQGQAGTHSYRFAPDFSMAFHTRSRLDEPPVTALVELPGHKLVRVLEDNARLRSRIREEGQRQTEFLQIDVGEGVVLDAWMMKPKGFDPARRYPVLVYVYSEPHAQTVLDAWGKVHAEYHRLISDLGYLVVSIDSRGTPAPKGAAWRRAVFGSLGPLSTAEQAAALRALARQRSYIDLSRVGIWGWSGGGSNTLNALFREPELYKVGIAVAAKPQPHLYNAWFQEIYMRTREVNAEGYRRSAPIHFAQGLRGDLLIIHGTGELNTHVQIIEGLVDRLIALGKRFDYTTYPNRRHGLREGKGTAVHLRSQMIRYLLEHLPAGPR